MVLQTKIPMMGSAAAASYDYEDLASALGYVAFYLSVSEENDVLDYHLVTQEMYSHLGDTSFANATEINFDSSTFNIARTVKGTAYLYGTVAGDADSSPSSFTYKLYKVNGSTETAISGAEVSVNPAPLPGGEYILVPIPLTETTINAGEFLRLEIVAATTANDIHIGSSPVDQDGDDLEPSVEEVTTITKLEIPFKIYI